MSKDEFEAIKAVEKYLRGMANEATNKLSRQEICPHESWFWINSWIRYNDISINAEREYYNVK